MNPETFRKMDPRTFQERLRGRHIVVTFLNLSIIPCDRGGLLTLNGLKEIVEMEGKIFTLLI